MGQETKSQSVVDMAYNWVFPTDRTYDRGARRMKEVLSDDGELVPLRQGRYHIGCYVRIVSELGHNTRRGRITYRYRQGRGFLYAVACHDSHGDEVTELVEEERLEVLSPMKVREYLRQRAAAEMKKIINH